VVIQIQNGQGVLGSLVPIILDMGQATEAPQLFWTCISTLGISKNDDEEGCFLK
jgi:hypothetical protein